jgi:hypothetical protein
MKFISCVFAFLLLTFFLTDTYATQRNDETIAYVCVETETQIWFMTDQQGNTRHYLRLASLGASRFDKIYAMLMTAIAQGKKITYDDAPPNAFTGWLIISKL